MIDEALRRRGAFQPGPTIRLADGQAWSFPAAEGVVRHLSDARRDEYLGLLRVLAEAEDRSEQRLAELALALFLIGINYQLEAAELQALFTFAGGSRALAEAQGEFHALACAHLHGLPREVIDLLDHPGGTDAPQKRWTRAWTWLRNALSSGRRFLGSPSGGAPLGS